MCGKFSDVDVREINGRYEICYRSGLTVYEEALVDGMYVSTYWNGAGCVSANCGTDAPFSEIFPKMQCKDFAFPQAFRFEANGQDLQSGWSWGGFEKSVNDDTVHAAVTLNHTLIPVSVKVHTLLDATAVLCRYLEIQNCSDRDVPIGHIAVLSGALQSNVRPGNMLSEGGDLYTIGYMKDSAWANEGNFKFMPLPYSGYSIYGRGRRERHRHPMYILRNNATGECFITQFAWSGNYSFNFDLDNELDPRNPETVFLSHSVVIDTPSPSRVLAANEAFETPFVHMGMILGETDDAINEMHTHIRKSVATRKTAGRHGWIEAIIPVNKLQNNKESMYKKVDEAAKFGCEVLFVDAGWYTPLNREGDWRYLVGDWEVGEGRYIDGIKSFSDYVHAKGMRWGLWADPERIGWESKQYNEHPDYHAVGKTFKTDSEGMAHISDKKVCAWVEGKIRHIIEDYECDFFRLDYNIGKTDADSYTVRGECFEQDQLRHYENLYDLYDRLGRDYPNVIFENCAGGGGRTDLGIMRYFDHTWISDWQLLPRSFRILNGMTAALPPEYCDRLFGGMEGFLRGDVKTQMRILIFGRPTMESFGTPVDYEPNTDVTEIISHHLDIYKSFYRPWQESCKIYHHTLELSGKEPQGFGALEVASEDKRFAMAGVFRLSGLKENEYTLCMKGLDVSKTYNVTFDNSGESVMISGFKLSQGIKIKIGGQMTSELILCEQN